LVRLMEKLSQSPSTIPPGTIVVDLDRLSSNFQSLMTHIHNNTAMQTIVRIINNSYSMYLQLLMMPFGYVGRPFIPAPSAHVECTAKSYCRCCECSSLATGGFR
jgi:hypothetical protein